MTLTDTLQLCAFKKAKRNKAKSEKNIPDYHGWTLGCETVKCRIQIHICAETLKYIDRTYMHTHTHTVMSYYDQRYSANKYSRYNSHDNTQLQHKTSSVGLHRVVC